MKEASIPHEEITYKIIGAAMRVQRRMPRGLREKHYQRALTQEMLKDGLSVEQEYRLEVYDRSTWVGRVYLDHWVNESVVVEDKAVARCMGNDEIAQAIAYMGATGAKVALLLNFGRERLEYKRILPPKVMQSWQRAIIPYVWTPDRLPAAPNYLTAANKIAEQLVFVKPQRHTTANNFYMEEDLPF
ncbi:MAG: GxxExxY protein [Oscillatoria sp. SIO1A7]|nr:GxxExxY protein [Oscillatoria sp. SIO1A7]